MKSCISSVNQSMGWTFKPYTIIFKDLQKWAYFRSIDSRCAKTIEGQIWYLPSIYPHFLCFLSPYKNYTHRLKITKSEQSSYSLCFSLYTLWRSLYKAEHLKLLFHKPFKRKRAQNTIKVFCDLSLPPEGQSQKIEKSLFLFRKLVALASLSTSNVNKGLPSTVFISAE